MRERTVQVPWISKEERNSLGSYTGGYSKIRSISGIKTKWLAYSPSSLSSSAIADRCAPLVDSVGPVGGR
jgi:hypothetical protein